MRITHVVIAVALPLAGLAIAASLVEPCCNVISTDALKGVVNVRNRFTGRLMQISSAELAKSLKFGDELDADAAMTRITSIKGVARTLPLIEPDAAEPCCAVVAVLKDRATVEALLGGIFANVQANPGKPTLHGAEPIADFRGSIKGVDAIKGVQADFSGALHGAEPISGIVVARNTATGAMHVLNLSVLSANGIGQVSAPITSSVKIGDPVSIDPATGIAVLKGGSGIYAFNLLGIKKTAEPVGAKRPSVAEPTGFGGEWVTTYGDMRLDLKDNGVSGTYVFMDSTVDGQVTGNVLRFTWFHKEDGAGGSGKFKLSESGHGFIGTWNNGSDPDVASSTWGGVRKGLFPEGAQGGNFAGKWATSSGNMVLTQKGDLVRGTYEDEAKGGHIEGIVKGDTLRLTWIQTKNRSVGSALFKLSASGKVFTGTWSSSDDPDNASGGTWTGTRG